MQTRQLFAFIGESQKVEYDFAPWEEDNGSVALTSVDWSTETGQAAITNIKPSNAVEELANPGIASATITTSQEGKSLIKITATAGNNVFVTYLKVLSKDPKTNLNDLARSHYY